MILKLSEEFSRIFLGRNINFAIKIYWILVGISRKTYVKP